MTDVNSANLRGQAKENDGQLAASKWLAEYQLSSNAPAGVEKQGVVSRLYECLLITLRDITKAIRERDFGPKDNENDSSPGPSRFFKGYPSSIHGQHQFLSSSNPNADVNTELGSCRKPLERIYQLFTLWGDGFDIQHGELDEVLSHSNNLRTELLLLLRSIGLALSQSMSLNITPST